MIDREEAEDSGNRRRRTGCGHGSWPRVRREAVLETRLTRSSRRLWKPTTVSSSPTTSETSPASSASTRFEARRHGGVARADPCARTPASNGAVEFLRIGDPEFVPHADACAPGRMRPEEGDGGAGGFGRAGYVGEDGSRSVTGTAVRVRRDGSRGRAAALCALILTATLNDAHPHARLAGGLASIAQLPHTRVQALQDGPRCRTACRRPRRWESGPRRCRRGRERPGPAPSASVP